MADLTSRLEADLADAERKAWDALARNKFWMFGYWAADVVKLSRRLGKDRSRKFPELADVAREVMAQKFGKPIGHRDQYLIYSVTHGAWWQADYSGYSSNLDGAGRYTREQAIQQAALGRDGYTARDTPSEVAIRLADAMTARPGTSWRDLERDEDAAECRALDLARKPATLKAAE
jgi:hypothetical protein